MQPTETDSGSLVRRAGARAAVGHLNHHHSADELAATPRRTGAAVYQKSKVITTNLFSARHRHTYGPRRAGVSRRAAYACGLSASPRPSRARMKSSQAIRDSVWAPYIYQLSRFKHHSSHTSTPHPRHATRAPNRAALCTELPTVSA